MTNWTKKIQESVNEINLKLGKVADDPLFEKTDSAVQNHIEKPEDNPK
jgi:hypothetical protein